MKPSLLQPELALTLPLPLPSPGSCGIRTEPTMEDVVLYCAATLALRYVRLGIFGRPERRLQQQVRPCKADPVISPCPLLVLS